MKHVFSALAGVFFVVVMALGGLFAAPTAASPTPPEQVCVVNVLDAQVCGTLVEPLPTVTVTLPPVTLGPSVVTVTLPPVTVRPDPVRITETIRPAPVETTVTAPPLPQPTATVTETVTTEGETTVGPALPQATVTETVRPNGQPVPTVTETVEIESEESAPSPTRQPDPDRGMLDEDTGFFSPNIDFGDGVTTIAEAALGALSLVATALAGMLILYAGYIMGRRSATREDTSFMRALLDSAKINR